MHIRVKTRTGAIVLLLGVPAWTQVDAQTTSTTAAASAPPVSNSTGIGDPGWFIAGLVTGLVVGAIGAKVFGGSRES